jgi:hypothetical protein
LAVERGKMYRFRNTKDLLDGHHELENQEIYFSDAVSLNDPMEGFRRFFWSGDLVAWRNLFRHYLLCLEQTYIVMLLSAADHKLSGADISVSMSEGRLPSDAFKRLYKSACERFLGDDNVQRYLGFLAGRKTKVEREELLVHLSTLHVRALNTVVAVFMEDGLVPRQDVLEDKENVLGKFVDGLLAMPEQDQNNGELIVALFDASASLFRQLDLMIAYNQTLPDWQKRWFLLSQFPNAYLNQITQLTYPSVYVASFTDDCTNAAAWGLYGDSGKGACLKFRTKETEGKLSIRLNSVIGVSGRKRATGIETSPIYGEQTFVFRRMEYNNLFPSLDFLRSLGVLPVDQLMSQWYTDWDGTKSVCAAHMESSQSQTEWRQAYWADIERIQSIKTKDWEFENEYRLILPDGVGLFDQKANRKPKYKFEDLEGVVFGSRTPIEDKLGIMKIIEGKCRSTGRTDFKFYQADYSPSLGKMLLSELRLLKFDVAAQPQSNSSK